MITTTVVAIIAVAIGFAVGAVVGYYMKATEAFDAGYLAAHDGLRDKRVNW